MNYNYLKMQTVHPAADWNRHTPKQILQYAVGALLYTPAVHKKIGEDLIAERYSQLSSLVLCLEDSVLDYLLPEAEQQLINTVQQVHRAIHAGEVAEDHLPLLFIRVRSPQQMLSIAGRIGPALRIITGFALPKFDSSNQEGYCQVIRQLNQMVASPVYMMPIIESAAVIHKETRLQELMCIREALDSVQEYVLNVRVGGNDFCHIYGLRRGRKTTIYEMSLIRDVLTDILNLLSRDYVVSAPVWEYFGEMDDDSWQQGLRTELKLDRLNGFIGKTAIHPSQLFLIQAAHVVPQADYEDALAIMNWQNESAGVAKSAHHKRMNEVKIHQRWAARILALAHVYGVKE